MKKKLVNSLNEFILILGQNEERIIPLYMFAACMFATCITFLYSVIPSLRYIKIKMHSSVIFLVFGIFFFQIISHKTKRLQIRLPLEILMSLLYLYVFLDFYPLIGPGIWTLAFTLIMLSILHKNFNVLVVLATELFFMGIFVWYMDLHFVIDNSYYLAQFIAFGILFLLSIMVYLLIYHKNTRIKNHLHALQKTNSELDEGEKKFKSIVHSLPDAIFIIDKQGIFIECASNEISWLMMSKKEILGKSMRDILTQEIYLVCIDKIVLAIETNCVQIFEYELVVGEVNSYYEVRFVNINGNQLYAIFRDTSEIRKKQIYIEYLSYHDQLTGLYNRRFFEEELSRLDTKTNMPLTIVMIDVNGLKLTNDVFGHAVGDKLLQKVADTLKKECRSEDIISRIGGDEFVILMPKLTSQEVEVMMERIYKSMAEEENEHIIVSVSIGWSTKVLQHQKTEDILLEAEENMYRRKLTEGKNMRNKTVHVIMRTLNDKSETEKKHSERVSELSAKIAQAMNLSCEIREQIAIAARLHDIGKISISESILNKEGPLDDVEFNMIKRHTESGYHILKSVDQYSVLADYILSHHEKWDGTGYPRGLKDTEIPIVSRIISVAEAYDTMTSDRPYRDAISSDLAIEEIVHQKNEHFDPEIVIAFCNMLGSEQ